MNNIKSFNKKAFTLIELLVVVSIIALLVSILLPALGRAREQARIVVCASGMRQIALSANYYANDYNDFVSAGGDGWGGGTHIVQHTSPVQRRNLAVYVYSGYIDNLDILRCAADQGRDLVTNQPIIGKQSKDWQRRWDNYDFRPDGGNGGPATAEEANIHSSYYMYAEGHGNWHPRHAGNRAQPFQYYKRDYFGVLLADGPWGQNGGIMRSWHGNDSLSRGWNAAGINAVVTFVERRQISDFWTENCYWSNQWGDNANIWPVFAERCGYVNAYPNRLDGYPW